MADRIKFQCSGQYYYLSIFIGGNEQNRLLTLTMLSDLILKLQFNDF